MKVESKTISPCRVKLSVKAEAAEIRDDYENVVARYMREAPVRGFRTGKAPRAVIERMYHQDLDRDIRQRLLGVFGKAATDETKLTVVNYLESNNLIYSLETGLSFDLTVDVAPEFKLPKYQSIPVKLIEPVVTDEQVEAQIKMLLRQFATHEDATEEMTVNQGDSVHIDFTATVDGKPMAEVVEDAGFYSSGTGFWMQADKPELIPEVSLGVVGMKMGEEKTFTVKFAKDFRVESLQGVKAEYQVKLTKFSRSVPMPEEKLIEMAKVDSGEKLRELIRESMQREAQSEEQNRRTSEVVAFLLKKCSFELPESELTEETDLTIRTLANEHVRRGGKIEELTENRDKFLEQATDSTKSRLRLRYILAAIAVDAGVEVSDEEVAAEIKRQALQAQKSVPEMEKIVYERNLRERIRIDIRNNKTLEFLVNSLK
ncbi:MAG: trigger factor [Lentisphaerae bacterium]|nr:trigger factor [Lentisphaerota bacterium]